MAKEQKKIQDCCKKFSLDPQIQKFDVPKRRFLNPTPVKSSLLEHFEAVIPLSRLESFLNSIGNLESCPFEIHFINK